MHSLLNVNILFVLPAFHIGGTERQALILALLLRNIGYNVIFYSFQRGPLEDILRKNGFQVEASEKCVGLLRPLRRVLALKRFICDNNISIVYSFLMSANFYASLAISKDNYLIWGVRSGLDSHNGKKDQLLIKLCQRLQSKSNLVICNSQYSKKQFAKIFKQLKVKYIPNFIDEGITAASDKAVADFKKEFALVDKVIISVVGRLDPVKNHKLVIEAFAQLKGAIKNLHLCLFYPRMTNFGKTLQNLVVEKHLDSDITFLENFPDMSLAYSVSRVICLSSHSESMPNILIEAMLCGKICVTTDVGDAAYIVSGAGEVAGGEAADYAAAIQRALTSSQTIFSDEVIENVRRKFNNQRTLELLINSLRELNPKF